MKRLRNTLGVQVTVSDAKATRLVADGTYELVSDDQQPKPDEMPNHPEQSRTRGKRRPSRTSLAGSIKDVAGPMWDTPV